MTRGRYRLLPHTADLRIEVRGADLPDLLAASVLALFSLLVDRRRVRGGETRTAAASGESLADVLFQVLRKALLLFSVDGFLVRNARVTIKGKRAVMTVEGEPFDRGRHLVMREIKAVTAHGLAVVEDARGVKARFVVDV